MKGFFENRSIRKEREEVSVEEIIAVFKKFNYNAILAS